MKVLLTGANGQLGRHLRDSAPEGIDLITSARSGGDAAVDLSDFDAVDALLEHHCPEVVLNAAAWTAVDAAEDHPDAAFRLNRDLPALLADWCARNSAVLVSYSTDYVFSGQGERPWREDDATDPASVYGRSKLAGEQAIAGSQARALTVRTAWVYSALPGNFLSAILPRAARGEALRVVADQTGSPTWAGMLAQDSWRLLEARLSLLGGPETYHIAGPEAMSWHAFAERAVTLAHELGVIERPVPVEPISSAQWPQPAPRPAWSVLDSQRFERLCNHQRLRVDSALRACLEQWKQGRC